MPGIKFFGDTKEFEKQAFDYHMPMGSLPRLFRSDIKDFDRTAHGYLKADKLRVDILRREMGLEISELLAYLGRVAAPLIRNQKYDVERFWYDVQRDRCCIIKSSIW